MPKRVLAPPAVVLMIGHSTRPLETFVKLLKAYGIEGPHITYPPESLPLDFESNK